MYRNNKKNQITPVGAEGTSQVEKGPQAALEEDVGYISLPRVDGMSLSLWQETTRTNPLIDHRTTADLPSQADVVIIGSGLSGALAALSLLMSENRPKSLVLVEARELCSGATGRNAGHCKPDIWRGFTHYSSLFGPVEALRILNNEKQTWQALNQYVKENNVDCDLWTGNTLDVMMTDEIAKTAADTFKEFKAAGGNTGDIEVTSCKIASERISRIHGAKAVYASGASTLHPWKLVAHLIERCLEHDGFNLQTWTPVTSVTGSTRKWSIDTARGSIITPLVIHTTNANAGVLLPEVHGPIYPFPHQCNKVIPPSTFSGSKRLQNSYAVLYPDAMYSVNPRQGGDGSILFGGWAPRQHELLEYVAQDPRRQTDDGLTDFEPVTVAVREFGTNGFQWDSPGRGHRAKYDRAWSGILGRSKDSVPYVGAVPGKKGQWISAGHNGHGMARIFTVSPALIKLINGASWEETGLPHSFQISEKRLRDLGGGSNLARL